MSKLIRVNINLDNSHSLTDFPVDIYSGTTTGNTTNLVYAGVTTSPVTFTVDDSIMEFGLKLVSTGCLDQVLLIESPSVDCEICADFVEFFDPVPTPQTTQTVLESCINDLTFVVEYNNSGLNGSPCSGGHGCNRAVFDILANSVVLGQVNLNNGGGIHDDVNRPPTYPNYPGASSGDRYNALSITSQQAQSIAANSPNGLIDFSFDCACIWSGANQNCVGSSCHTDVSWVRIIKDMGLSTEEELYNGCPNGNFIEDFDPCPPQPTPQPTPNTTPNATPDATPVSTPNATPNATPIPTSNATPQPTPDATPNATPDATPDATPSPTSTPNATPLPTDGSTPQPTPDATPQPTPDVTPNATPAPTPQPTPEATANCDFDVDIDIATPTPTPSPSPTPTVTENCDFDVDINIATPTPTPTAEPLTGPDCGGIEEGDQVQGVYWEWDIVSQNIGDTLFEGSYFDHGMDCGWEFPNGIQHQMMFNVSGGSDGINNLPDEQYTLFTSEGTGSGKIYGKPTNVGAGGNNGTAAENCPIGGTITISENIEEGDTVLRKVSQLLYAPAPQWWVTRADSLQGEQGNYTLLPGHAYQWGSYPSLPGDNGNGQYWRMQMGTITDPVTNEVHNYNIKGMHPIGTDKDAFEAIVNPNDDKAVIIIDATSASGIDSCDPNAITDPS